MPEGKEGCILVIGLDGATFNVLDPFIEKGHMPNLARLRDEGAHGVLMSTVPSLSGPAWTSFFTGLNPGKHGVFSWRLDPRSREGGNLVSSRTVLGDKVWQLLGRAGLKSCIIGVPVTYPPERMEGAMVTGVLTPLDAKVFTYPPELSEELRAQGYRTDYEFSNDDYDGMDETRRSLYIDIKDLAKVRFGACEMLLAREPWDLFIVMFGQTDQVQHFFWDDEEVLVEFFGIMDRYIGRLVDDFSERFPHLHVIIMSDHGFDAAPTKRFAMNAWLEAQGLVSEEERAARSRMFELARKLSHGLKKVGLDLGKTRMGRKRFEDESKKVLDKKLVVLEASGLYIDRERAGDRFDEIKTSLIKGLRQLKGPDDRPIFKEVHAKEDVYMGEGEGEGGAMDRAADVVLVPDPDYYIDPGLLSKEVFGTHGGGTGRSNWTGMHNGSPEGVFFIHGPGVRKGERIARSSIMDITPTLLHLAGLGIPSSMDGKVIEEAFEGTYLEKRPVRKDDGPGREGPKGQKGHEYSEEEARDVEERLRGLGYLD